MTHKLTGLIKGIVVVGSRLCKSDRFRYKRSLNGDPKQQKKSESDSGVPEFRSLLTKCPPLKKFNSGTLKKTDTDVVSTSASVFSTSKVPAHIISNGSTVRNGSVDSTCFQKSISTGQCPLKLRGLKMKEIVTPSQRVSFKMPKRPRLEKAFFVAARAPRTHLVNL